MIRIRQLPVSLQDLYNTAVWFLQLNPWHFSHQYFNWRFICWRSFLQCTNNIFRADMATTSCALTIQCRSEVYISNPSFVPSFLFLSICLSYPVAWFQLMPIPNFLIAQIASKTDVLLAQISISLTICSNQKMRFIELHHLQDTWCVHQFL